MYNMTAPVEAGFRKSQLFRKPAFCNICVREESIIGLTQMNAVLGTQAK